MCTWASGVWPQWFVDAIHPHRIPGARMNVYKHRPLSRWVVTIAAGLDRLAYTEGIFGPLDNASRAEDDAIGCFCSTNASRRGEFPTLTALEAAMAAWRRDPRAAFRQHGPSVQWTVRATPCQLRRRTAADAATSEALGSQRQQEGRFPLRARGNRFEHPRHDPPLHRRQLIGPDEARRLLNDPRSKFHAMFGVEGWRLRRGDEPGCWGRSEARATDFFHRVLSGADCDANWLEGAVGSERSRPLARGDAPALMGEQHKRTTCREACPFFR